MKHLTVTTVILLQLSLVAPFCLAMEENSLTAYLQLAMTHNEDIEAAKARLQSTVYMVEQMGILPDPMLDVQYYVKPVETRTGPQNAAVGISQKIPWFGKLSLQKEKSEHNIILAKRRFAAVQFRVARQVKQAWIQYGFVGLSKKIVQENVELLRYLEGVVRSGYASGKSSYGDVLKLQIELAKATDRLKSLEDQVIPLQISLESLLGGTQEVSFAMPDELPVISLTLPEEEILEQALKRNPALLESKEKVFQAQTDLELVKRDFYPDFTFSLRTIFTGAAEYGDPPDSGDNPVIAGVSINLPVFFDKRINGVDEKRADIKAAVTSNRQYGRTLLADIQLTLFQYREALRQYELYDLELTPKARQKLEVSLEAFQGGQYSILELIDAEKVLLDFELAKSNALMNQAMQVARLEELSGVTLAHWDNSVDAPAHQ